MQSFYKKDTGCLEKIQKRATN